MCAVVFESNLLMILAIVDLHYAYIYFTNITKA